MRSRSRRERINAYENPREHTQESHRHSDDASLGILHFDRGDVIHLTAEGAADHRNVPMAHRYTVLSDDSRCEGHAACRVFVVSDLSRYGLSIGSYQVRRLVV